MIKLTVDFSSVAREARDNRIPSVHWEKITVSLEFYIQNIFQEWGWNKDISMRKV